ncbi:V-set domain-containing T-cell activation inhibitor 1-like isoform X2 [Megalops cyprinoides]|uniref:V-set domain-containing T-cell activation inhibitor 1-like isoform X2 n=1 Tax=Megalops cyprinoides TaxID=118141 RepID=UPI001864A428|nr:V-set domain-containing T-cell activation inhibitor 1-like isoform X2 [Megalops cyprinoides]
MSSMNLLILTLILFHSFMVESAVHVYISKPNVTGPYLEPEGTVLPCLFHFDQIVPLKNICLTWWRNDTGQHSVVYDFENGQRQKQKEDPAYSNRTDLFYKLTEGDASLTMQKLTLQDAGLYICEVWSCGSSPGQGRVNLSVAARPSTLDFISKEDKTLSFSSSGWFPRPSVLWTDMNNQTVSDVTKINITQGKDGLYSIYTVLYTDTHRYSRKLHLRYINPYIGNEITEFFLQQATSSDSQYSFAGVFIGGIVCSAFWILIIFIVSVMVVKYNHQRVSEDSPLLPRPRSDSCSSFDGPMAAMHR